MMLLTGLTHILNREQEKQKTVGKKNVTIESIDRFNSRFILKNIYIYSNLYWIFQIILWYLREDVVTNNEQM